MITQQDLDWWYEVAPTLVWTFAKTYADPAPHESVVFGRNGCPLSREDFVRAAKVIATFGQPAKFYSMTGLYLTSADGSLKWWTMDAQLDDTDLINQATTDRVYGVQDAPSTETGCWTDYDAIATEFDARRSRDYDEQLRLLIQEHFGEQSPRTLDIGCGTGALLDLGVVDLGTYTGLDESHAMLNMLVRKHPKVGSLIPGRFPDVEIPPHSYDLVTAIDVPEIDVESLRALSHGLVVVGLSGKLSVFSGRRSTSREPSH